MSAGKSSASSRRKTRIACVPSSDVGRDLLQIRLEQADRLVCLLEGIVIPLPLVGRVTRLVLAQQLPPQAVKLQECRGGVVERVRVVVGGQRQGMGGRLVHSMIIYNFVAK